MSLAYRVVERVINLPRLTRVILCGLFALAVTLSLSPLVDRIYTEFFFAASTVGVPALVSAAFGLVMYMLGWWLVIGTIGERPPARLGVLLYLLLGLLAIVVVVLLFIGGAALLNQASRPI